MTQQQYLKRAAREMNRWIAAEQYRPCHNAQIHWGFCGGRINRNTLGECWSGDGFSNGRPQIFIAPVNQQSIVSVLDTLLHELIHCATVHNHGPEFQKLAQRLGMEPPWVRAGAGAALVGRIERLMRQLGKPPSFGFISPNDLPVSHRRAHAMDEARIILPSIDIHNHRINKKQRQKIEEKIINEFGGYTAVPGEGAYTSDKGGVTVEPVIVVDIAVRPRSKRQLETLAKEVALDLNQESVYLRLANGAVEFVKPSNTGTEK